MTSGFEPIGKIERKFKILTWHVHGSYLYYLTQAPHEFYLPIKPGKPEGFGGRSGSFLWGDNVHDIPVEDIPSLNLDAILFQSRKNIEVDQFEILTPEQRQLPKLYLEHDPPREHPTDTKHWVDDPGILLIHCTHFNRLMWDSGSSPTRVIDHGVIVPEDVNFTGELAKGLVVVNNLRKRGRRLGLDIFEEVRKRIPLDLIGIGSEELGGLGAIPLGEMAGFISQYRFFFNPIRYTSLGLAVCEAMMLGMPIIGMATTEMVSVIENGVSGYVHTNIDRLVDDMEMLLADPEKAKILGMGAKKTAHARFNINRFCTDWNAAFSDAIQMFYNTQPVIVLGEK